MIQRKQTLFLLLAVIVCALGLFFPIGSIAPEGMGTDSMVYNLGVVTGEGGLAVSATCIPLFVLLSVTAILSLVTIFLYKNRKVQMSICKCTMLLPIVCCFFWGCFISTFPSVACFRCRRRPLYRREREKVFGLNTL